MHVPLHAESRVATATRVRLRRDIYDTLVAKRGASAVGEQVRLTGIPRKTLYRIRRGDEPSMSSAVKICDALGVAFEELFERVEDPA